MSLFKTPLAFWRSARQTYPSQFFGADEADLKRVPVLSSLPEIGFRRLLEGSQRHDCQAGEKLIRQGEPSLDAVILLRGEARVVAESAHGETLLARVAAPELLGEIGALANLPRTATVIANQNVRVMRVPRGLLREVLSASPDILLSVIGRLGESIRNVNGAIGLYAGSIAALEREDFDLEHLLRDLKNPVESMRDFSAAFERLAKHLANERRQRKDMASAALIQRAMLPHSLDLLDTGGRVVVEGGMRPAREVGGDLYDAFMLDDTHLALMIGDVSGKGVPASLFMSMTMMALRLVGRQESDVGAIAQRVNTLLYEQNAASMFTTLFLGILDVTSLSLAYANCGHNPPVVLRGDGTVSPLIGGGTPLGILPDRKTNKREVQLAPGDSLFLFTDGVTESHDVDGAEYTEERLCACLEAVAREGRPDLVDAVMEDVSSFARGAEQFDDITCLCVRVPA